MGVQVLHQNRQIEVMIDLTKKFEQSIEIVRSNLFDEPKWLNSVQKMVKPPEIEILWNEEQDNWLKLGNTNELIIMAARHMPFLFINNETLLRQIHENYCNNLIHVLIKDCTQKIYSINKSKIIEFLSWRSPVINNNSFSVTDLFYATH
jgi:hypothetical protein